jgi:magnesium-transporting ATPase (P-type)
LEIAISQKNIGFTYIGSFGLHDSLRPKVMSCIQYARLEGKLNVILVSGDHKLTAQVVALKAGVLT